MRDRWAGRRAEAERVQARTRLRQLIAVEWRLIAVEAEVVQLSNRRARRAARRQRRKERCQDFALRKSDRT
jgi:hypothetical protein